MEKKTKPRQLELFSSAVEPQAKVKQRHSIFSNYTNLNIENFIVLSVIFLMVIIFSFSLGVERGKKITNTSGSQFVQAEEKESSEKKFELEPKVVQVKDQSHKQEASPEKYLFTYTIQVASFKKEAYVKEEAKRLKSKGYETIIIPKGKWIILCVGKFEDKKEAEVLRKELRKKYGDCIIRRL